MSQVDLALVVDDDDDDRHLTELFLRRAGYRVVAATTGQEAVDGVGRHQPDVVVLDVGLQDISGVEVCRRIRRFSDVPIMFLTARDQESDVITGLASGADDYLTKPLSAPILSARTAALLRRRRGFPSPQDRISVGPLLLDLGSRALTVDGRAVDLTKTEFNLLAILMTAPNRVFTREQLLREVWGSDAWDDRVLEPPLSRLRRKILAAGGPQLIAAERGVGYRLGFGKLAAEE